MKENDLLRAAKKRNERTYAKYRIVTPKGPLEVLEMDIKYVWVTQDRQCPKNCVNVILFS